MTKPRIWLGRPMIPEAMARLKAAKMNLEAPDGSDASIRKSHGKAGKVCLLFCALGILTATVVVFGMFQRAGLV